MDSISKAGVPEVSEVSENLISYIIGNHGSYKVISRPVQVKVQGFDLNIILAVFKTRFLEHIIGIDRLNAGQYSKTIHFNIEFTFNFRIHSASSRVESSLKFVVKPISLPPAEIYTNHISFS